jgi:hypothetical protein
LKEYNETHIENIRNEGRLQQEENGKRKEEKTDI